MELHGLLLRAHGRVEHQSVHVLLFRFLGKVVSEYISVFVREGERRLSIFENGFDYERWTKTFSKMKQVIGMWNFSLGFECCTLEPLCVCVLLYSKVESIVHIIVCVKRGLKLTLSASMVDFCVLQCQEHHNGYEVFSWYLQPPGIPASLKKKMKQGDQMITPSKEAIIEDLTSFIDGEVLAWCEQVDIGDLCVHNHKQLLEFKVSELVVPSNIMNCEVLLSISFLLWNTNHGYVTTPGIHINCRSVKSHKPSKLLL